MGRAQNARIVGWGRAAADPRDHSLGSGQASDKPCAFSFVRFHVVCVFHVLFALSEFCASKARERQKMLRNAQCCWSHDYAAAALPAINSSLTNEGDNWQLRPINNESREGCLLTRRPLDFSVALPLVQPERPANKDNTEREAFY